MNQLAIDGGTPTFAEGPPSWPLDDPDIRQALLAMFADGSWGRYHSHYLVRLEEVLAEWHGVAHALPVCSGTFAVELALRAMQVGPGDEVILAGYDFPGNFRAVEAVGAKPVLVDIDPATWCLDATLLPKAQSTSTRAILVSHLHGGLADMQSICQFAQEHRIGVVEDACQSPGADVQGRIAGAWGDVSTLSFGGSKLLTAGRGGAILTPNDELAQRAKVFCERGNHAFPLSELQAGLLLPQIDKLAERNRQRSLSVALLREELQDLPALRPVHVPESRGSASYYKFAWLVESDSFTRAEFIEAIRAEGAAIDAGFRGFTRRGSRRCRRVGNLANSQSAAECTLLLHHPILLELESVRRLAMAIRNVCERLSS